MRPASSPFGCRVSSFNSRTPGGVRQYRNICKPSEYRFNSRTPGGVRPLRNTLTDEVFEFQFTHPGRGATYRRNNQVTNPLCFNSRTPGGVRLLSVASLPTLGRVSIHAPREGCDAEGSGDQPQASRVSIHAPREGCDLPAYPVDTNNDVSIHAPREGCDCKRARRSLGMHGSFNSRTPGGVRRTYWRGRRSGPGFQFTHPGRGATDVRGSAVTPQAMVSIHAPREGCDRIAWGSIIRGYSFNSRTPGGVRRDLSIVYELTEPVSIHAPREGCD